MNSLHTAAGSTTPEYQNPSDIEQLSLLFSAQQMRSAAADALVLQESQKTLGVYQEVITASKAEHQHLQLEVVALRERLATMESQKRESEAIYAAEKKAIQERSAEEIAALQASLAKSKKRAKALNTLIKQHIHDGQESVAWSTPISRRIFLDCYAALDEKRKSAGGKK